MQLTRVCMYKPRSSIVPFSQAEDTSSPFRRRQRSVALLFFPQAIDISGKPHPQLPQSTNTSPPLISSHPPPHSHSHSHYSSPPSPPSSPVSPAEYSSAPPESSSAFAQRPAASTRRSRRCRRRTGTPRAPACGRTGAFRCRVARGGLLRLFVGRKVSYGWDERGRLGGRGEMGGGTEA